MVSGSGMVRALSSGGTFILVVVGVVGEVTRLERVSLYSTTSITSRRGRGRGSGCDSGLRRCVLAAVSDGLTV